MEGRKPEYPEKNPEQGENRMAPGLGQEWLSLSYALRSTHRFIFIIDAFFYRTCTSVAALMDWCVQRQLPSQFRSQESRFRLGSAFNLKERLKNVSDTKTVVEEKCRK